jgi:hypothetical protein
MLHGGVWIAIGEWILGVVEFSKKLAETKTQRP